MMLEFFLARFANILCLKDHQDDRTSKYDNVRGKRSVAGKSSGTRGSGVAEGAYKEAEVWSQELERHFSFSVVKGNEVMEDQSQVEISRRATFVGVYDGHGGPDASLFVNEHLFRHFVDSAGDNGTISMETVTSAIAATEESFLTHVQRSQRQRPLIAAQGSCCLVGVIADGTLYVANLGDSRAVFGKLDGARITAEQLTVDHNASREEIQRELQARHPEDPNIVVKKNGAWRVKGITQVTRAIGDAYLKHEDFRFDEWTPRFHFPGPLVRPLITAEPHINTRHIHPEDRFVIFASDGLWEHLTNQEAVELVHNSPQDGVAGELVRRAMREGVRKAHLRYGDGVMHDTRVARRVFHDDITVIVLFLDHTLLQRNSSIPDVSFKGSAATSASALSLLRGENWMNSALSLPF